MLARTDDEQDDIGQLIATIVSASEALYQRVVFLREDGTVNPDRDKSLQRIAHDAEIKMLDHAATQMQFAASSAAVVRDANEQMTWEDRKLVRIR